jgi:hypothetical protein
MGTISQVASAQVGTSSACAPVRLQLQSQTMASVLPCATSLYIIPSPAVWHYICSSQFVNHGVFPFLPLNVIEKRTPPSAADNIIFCCSTFASPPDPELCRSANHFEDWEAAWAAPASASAPWAPAPLCFLKEGVLAREPKGPSTGSPCVVAHHDRW